MSKWYVGQRVVCVDDRGALNLLCGETYTVSIIFGHGDGICLRETQPNPGDTAFWSWRFRPATQPSVSQELVEGFTKRQVEERPEVVQIPEEV